MFKSFEKYDDDISLKGHHEKKLISEDFFSDFDLALSNKADPKIFLAAAEPGAGKSRGIQKYLNEIVEGKRTVPDNGIIVFVSRLEEIGSYIEGARLPNDKFAVVAGTDIKESLKKFGGLIDPNNAPIIFTTTQKLRYWCGDSFNDMEIYHYKGRPRSLRLWDEDYYPVEAVNISIDRLSALKLVLRPSYPDLVNEIEIVEAESHLTKFKEITVDVSVRAIADAARRGVAGLNDAEKDVLSSFAALAGKKVRLVEGAYGVRCLVGERSRLPDDIAPLFVFDASARVSDGYSLMERAGVPIQRLATRPIRYTNARFMHMKLAASKSKLRSAPARARIIFEASVPINAARTEEWLVLYCRDDGIDLPAELQSACPGVKLHFVYWGDHRAKNDYRHIRKVMCIGLQRYSGEGYDEVHVKYCGNVDYRISDIVAMRLSETCSTMLQGFARSNMRSHSSGECGDSHIYIIDRQQDLQALISKTFRLSRYRVWEPSEIVLTGRKLELFKHLTALDADELAKGVKKKDIYSALKIEKGNFSTYLKCPKLRSALASRGIAVERTCFIAK